MAIALLYALEYKKISLQHAVNSISTSRGFDVCTNGDFQRCLNKKELEMLGVDKNSILSWEGAVAEEGRRPQRGAKTKATANLRASRGGVHPPSATPPSQETMTSLEMIVGQTVNFDSPSLLDVPYSILRMRPEPESLPTHQCSGIQLAWRSCKGLFDSKMFTNCLYLIYNFTSFFNFS